MLQQTLKDLDSACQKVGTWRVLWRAKCRWAPSMRFPEGRRMRVQRLTRRWGQVNLPKLGQVRFRMTREVGGQIRSATVALRDGRWQIILLVEDGVMQVQPPRHDLRPAVGVDRGVKIALALSDGRKLDQTFLTDPDQHRMARVQRRMARQKGPRSRPFRQAQQADPKVRGRRQQPSKRYLRSKVRLARIQARARRRRDDFLTKTAHQLAAECAVVVVEKLGTAGMTRRPARRPDPDRAGVFLPNRAAAKAGLNRAILAKGWGRFALTLAHQARYTGTQIVAVPAAFTSQRCHQCGHTEAGNRESQAVFRCLRCGHTANADINAARNILAAGLAAAGRARPDTSGNVNHQAA